MMIVVTLTWVRGVIRGGDSEARRGWTVYTAWSAWLACTSLNAALSGDSGQYQQAARL